MYLFILFLFKTFLDECNVTKFGDNTILIIYNLM